MGEEHALTVAPAPQGDAGGDLDGGLFEALYAAHFAQIRQHIEGIVGDPAEAEELAQQTFLNAWRGLPRVLASPEPFYPRSWLYRIATNVALDLVRGRRVRPLTTPLDVALANLPNDRTPLGYRAPTAAPRVAFTSADREADPQRAALDHELRDEVRQVLDGLWPRYALELRLRYVADLSYREIEACLGGGLPALKRSLVRARDAVRPGLAALLAARDAGA